MTAPEGAARALEGFEHQRLRLRQELLRDPNIPRQFVIVADWSSREALDAFGRGPQRDQLTAALRDLRATALNALYAVAPVRRTLMKAGLGVR